MGRWQRWGLSQIQVSLNETDRTATWPQVKQQKLELEDVKDSFSPESVDTSVSDFWSCEEINFCCFKPSGLWWLVTVAVGRWCWCLTTILSQLIPKETLPPTQQPADPSVLISANDNCSLEVVQIKTLMTLLTPSISIQPHGKLSPNPVGSVFKDNQHKIICHLLPCEHLGPSRHLVLLGLDSSCLPALVLATYSLFMKQ